jgi:hypothetical protein
MLPGQRIQLLNWIGWHGRRTKRRADAVDVGAILIDFRLDTGSWSDLGQKVWTIM